MKALIILFLVSSVLGSDPLYIVNETIQLGGSYNYSQIELFSASGIMTYDYKPLDSEKLILIMVFLVDDPNYKKFISGEPYSYYQKLSVDDPMPIAYLPFTSFDVKDGTAPLYLVVVNYRSDSAYNMSVYVEYTGAITAGVDTNLIVVLSVTVILLVGIGAASMFVYRRFCQRKASYQQIMTA